MFHASVRSFCSAVLLRLTLHLEVHLKDLLYCTEGSPDFIDKEKTIVNASKMDQVSFVLSACSSFSCSPQMGKIISVIYHAQQKRYNFLVEPIIANMLAFSELPEHANSASLGDSDAVTTYASHPIRRHPHPISGIQMATQRCRVAPLV